MAHLSTQNICDVTCKSRIPGAGISHFFNPIHTLTFCYCKFSFSLSYVILFTLSHLSSGCHTGLGKVHYGHKLLLSPIWNYQASSLMSTPPRFNSLPEWPSQQTGGTWHDGTIINKSSPGLLIWPLSTTERLLSRMYEQLVPHAIWPLMKDGALTSRAFSDWPVIGIIHKATRQARRLELFPLSSAPCVVPEGRLASCVDDRHIIMSASLNGISSLVTCRCLCSNRLINVLCFKDWG